MFLILMGAQGSGKGTQAALLGPKQKLVRVATGDLFRAAIASKSELGQLVEAVLARGDLVTDEMTIPIVRQRLTEIAAEMKSGTIGGVLFDGFPRTEPQAQALDEILAELGHSLTAVIEIDVPRETLIERMAGRRVCELCGTVYQLQSNPPKLDATCDNDGRKLVQRDDDKPEAIARRLSLFDKQTAPLLTYYGSRGLVYRVNGDQAVESVQAEIDNVLSHVGVA